MTHQNADKQFEPTSSESRRNLMSSQPTTVVCLALGWSGFMETNSSLLGMKNHRSLFTNLKGNSRIEQKGQDRVVVTARSPCMLVLLLVLRWARHLPVPESLFEEGFDKYLRSTTCSYSLVYMVIPIVLQFNIRPLKIKKITKQRAKYCKHLQLAQI